MAAACTAREPAGVRAGDRFPETSVARMEGAGRIGLRPADARVVVVNVWATWCAPCRREMRSLERLHQRMEGAGVRVVGISVDEDANLAAEFVRAQGLTFANGLASQAWAGAAPLAVRSFPTTIVIDAAGRVAWREEGARDWADATTVARLAAAGAVDR